MDAGAQNPDDAPPADPQQSSRGRLLIAAASAVGLIAVVVVVLVAGRDPAEPPAPPSAPSDCVSSWNEDEGAVAFGLHNASAHAYEEVQVSRIEAGDIEAADAGLCAVVFARSTLDPEPGAAGLILEKRKWEPLAYRTGYDASKLTNLQSEAIGLANAELQSDGTIVAN